MARKIRDKTIAKLAAQASRSTHRQEKEEAENLDAMWKDDLRQFVQDSVKRGGNKWVRTYAGLKADAMKAREAGNIRLAVQIENELDKIYKLYIPNRLKW